MFVKEILAKRKRVCLSYCIFVEIKMRPIYSQGKFNSDLPHTNFLIKFELIKLDRIMSLFNRRALISFFHLFTI